MTAAMRRLLADPALRERQIGLGERARDFCGGARGPRDARVIRPRSGGPEMSDRRHRVLVVRGDLPTPWELPSFRLLPERFEVRYLRSGTNRFEVGDDVPDAQPVRALRDRLPAGRTGDVAARLLRDRYLGAQRRRRGWCCQSTDVVGLSVDHPDLVGVPVGSPGGRLHAERHPSAIRRPDRARRDSRTVEGDRGRRRPHAVSAQIGDHERPVAG